MTQASGIDFQSGVEFVSIPNEFIDGLKNETLKFVGAAFVDNVERARRMGTALIAVSHHAGQLEMRLCGARHELGLAPDDKSEDSSERFGDAFERVSRRWVAGRVGLGDEGINKLVMEDGCNTIDILVRAGRSPSGKDTGPVPSGVQSILGAILLMSYAAYESFASDLWIEALNVDSGLAKTWLGNHGDKQIKLAELAGFDFDVSNRMGSFLHQSQKVSFQSLDAIKTGYVDAFGGGAVSDCFEPWAELRLTEKTRHLLAHRSGIVDDKFLRDVKKHPEYATLQVGNELRLVGGQVRDRVDACVHSAAALLRFVDVRLAARAK